MKSLLKALNQYRGSNKTAIEFDGDAISYKVLHERADNLANYLCHLPWQEERRVALCMEPSIAYVITLLAALKAGVEFVPLDVSQTPENLWSCLHRANITRVLHDQSHAELGERLHEQRSESADLYVDSIEDLLAKDHAMPEHPKQPNEWAYIILTSGSTGQPKIVRVRLDALGSRIASIATAMDIGTEDCYAQLCALEFDASIQEILVALTCGAKLAIMPKAIRDHIPALMEALAGATAATLVPVYVEQFNFDALPNLRIMIGTGSSLADQYIQAILKSGTRFINGYGATEEAIGSFLAELVLDADGHVCNHLGKPMDGIGLMFRRMDPLEDEDEDDAHDPEKVDTSLLTQADVLKILEGEPNAEFEVVTYFENPNEYLDTPCRFQKGFAWARVGAEDRMVYYTGDVVCFDESLRLRYKRRLGMSIKRNHKLVDLAAINHFLESHAKGVGCAECQGVVITDEKSVGVNTNDLVVIARPLNPKVPIDQQHLTRMIAQSCMLQGVPSHVLFVNKPFPRHPAKRTVIRKELLASVQDTLQSDKCPIQGVDTSELSPVETIIANIWREVLGLDEGYELRRDDNFLNLGASSIYITQMCVKVERRFRRDCMPGCRIQLNLSRLLVDASLARIAREVIQQLKPDRQEVYGCHSILMDCVGGDPETARYAVVLVHSLYGDANEYDPSFCQVYENDETVVWSISAPSFTESTFDVPSSIDELARLYGSAIENKCKQCDYIRLVGWSAGGVVVERIKRHLGMGEDPMAGRIDVVMLDSYASVAWQAMTHPQFYDFVRDLPRGLHLRPLDTIRRLFDKRCSRKAAEYRSKRHMVEMMCESLREAGGKDRRKNARHAEVISGVLTAILSDVNTAQAKPMDGVTLYRAKKEPIMRRREIDLEHPDHLFWGNPMLRLVDAGPKSTHGKIVQDEVLQDAERHAMRRAMCLSRYAQSFERLRRTYSEDTMDPVASLLLGRHVKIEDIVIEPTITSDDRQIRLPQLFAYADTGVVVLAGPDMGKTTLVRTLAYRWASQRAFAADVDVLISIELGKIYEYVNRHKDSDVVHFLQFALGMEGDKNFEALMRAYFSKEESPIGEVLRFCFLLDGLNEVRGCLEVKDRQSHEAVLLKQLLLISDAVIATQPSVLHDGLVDLEGREKLHLTGLNEFDQIRLCLNNVFRIIQRPDTDAIRDELIAWLTQDENSHQRVLKQPLMLFLFCVSSENVGEMKRQFKNMALFYEKVIALLLRQFLLHKHGVRSAIPDEEVQDVTSPLLAILSEIAFQMCMHGDSVRPKDDLMQVFCKASQWWGQYNQFEMSARKQVGASTPLFNANHTDKNYDQLIKTGIIREEGGSVGFLLESIRDYLAAKHVVGIWLAATPDAIDQKGFGKQAIRLESPGLKGCDMKMLLKNMIDDRNYFGCMAYTIDLLHGHDSRPQDVVPDAVDSSDDEADQVAEPMPVAPQFTKTLFAFICKRLDKKRSFDPLHLLEHEAERMPNGFWVAAAVIERCCEDIDVVRTFCEGTDFLERFTAMAQTILIEFNRYAFGFVRNLERLLFDYPRLKRAVFEMGGFDASRDISSALTRVQTSHLGCVDLLATAAKESLPFTQLKILRNARYFPVRLMFDPRLRKGHHGLMVRYRDGCLEEPPRPGLVWMVMRFQSDALVREALKDPHFEEDFFAFLKPMCDQLQETSQLLDQEIERVRATEEALSDDWSDTKDRIHHIAAQACRFMHAVVFAENCPERWKVMVFDCVKAILLPTQQDGFMLYQRKNTFTWLKCRTRALDILCTSSELECGDPMVWPVFLAFVDAYKVTDPRTGDTTFQTRLEGIGKSFWSAHKSSIKPRLYEKNPYESSELQKAMWGVVKFMVSCGSNRDCEELLGKMMDEEMMHQGVYVGPVYLLSARLSQPLRRRLRKRLADIVPAKIPRELREHVARQYAHALIGLTHLRHQTDDTVQQLYCLFKNDHHFPKGLIDERIAYEVAFLILMGDLEVESDYKREWFLSACYRLGNTGYRSYMKDRLYASLIDLAVLMMPEDNSLVFKLLARVGPVMHEGSDARIRFSGVLAVHRMLQRPHFANMVETQQLYAGDGSLINLATIVTTILALGRHSPEAYLLLEHPCVIKHLMRLPGQNGDANLLQTYLNRMLTELHAMPRVGRIHVMCVIHHLLSTHVLTTSAFYDRDRLKQVVVIRLYDGYAAVRLASAAILHAYFKEPIDSSRVTAALQRDEPAEWPRVLKDLHANDFPTKLLDPFEATVGVTVDDPLNGTPSRLGLFAYRRGYGSNPYLPLLETDNYLASP